MKIMVVDDHELIREGLRPVLKQLGDGDVIVLEAWNYPVALALVDEHPDLDLILLDLNLPGVSGFAALIDLQERHPEIPVVILSATESRDILVSAFKRGAVGFIPKSASSQVMLSALRLVLSGGVYVPPEILSQQGGKGVDSALDTQGLTDPATLGLTERQIQVLALMIQGK